MLFFICSVSSSEPDANTLREEVKTWKREFTPEFKAWYINMMGTCNHRLLLDSDKNKNEWWFRSALKIAHPEIETFDGEPL